MRTALLTAAAALAFCGPIAAQGAAVPFAETFDGPWPTAAFSFATTAPGSGRAVQIAPSALSPASPQGGFHLGLDVAFPGFATNDLVLSVDLATSGGGVLKYWAKETFDEPHAGIDGCFLRDGPSTAWAQVVDHVGLTGSWTEFTVDLAVAAGAFGMSLTAAFEIRFTQRDDQSFPSDGLQLDDVRVLSPPPPDTGQWNRTSARLVVPGSFNLAGQPPVDGVRGPFFGVAGALAPFPFVVGGSPNAPWILVAGPLRRGVLLDPSVGSIDLGVLNGALLESVAIVLDGTAPGFLNAFADTGPFGTSSLVFAAPALPPGFAFALQAVVQDGSTWRATAATETLIQ